ncbi:MAG TPA: hypothetical protein VIQ60_05325 [Gemmatimonadaceae bacterium]
MGAADITFSSAKHGVNTVRRVLHRCSIEDGVLPVDWERSEELQLSVDELDRSPAPGATFARVPRAVTEAGVTDWGKLYERWLRTSQSLILFRSPGFKLVSEPDETEGAFRARVQIVAREGRDARVAAMRKKYDARLSALEERLARADQAVERERDQAGSARMNAFVQAGTAVLGTLFGRKRASVTTASRVGSAIRGAGRAYTAGSDVTRAEESAGRLREQCEELEHELEAEIAGLDASFDAQQEQLESIAIRPRASDIHVHFVGIGWGSESRAAS